jgi:undecaprenyl-diphosphatase
MEAPFEKAEKGMRSMNVLHTAVLGIIQGLAEFLPISSSGHLEVAQRLLGLQAESMDMMLLTVLLHAGTLAAVVVVFWEDWIGILKNLFRSRLLGLLIVASLPALIVKLGLKAVDIDIDAVFGGGFLGIGFLVTGVFLLLAELFSHRGRHAAAKRVTVKNAAVMGCFQALAMIPGVSRSGSTTLGGTATGLTKRDAIKFSFLMSAPAVVGSLLLEGKDAYEQGAFGFLTANIVPIAVGVVLAAVIGILTARAMLKIINKVSFNWFALYVFLVGITVLIMQATGFAGFPPISTPLS